MSRKPTVPDADYEKLIQKSIELGDLAGNILIEQASAIAIVRMNKDSSSTDPDKAKLISAMYAIAANMFMN